MEMPLDKAKEILADTAWHGSTTFNQDFTHALKLGIEAMTRLQNNRNTKPVINLSLLPGEVL
ncbi:hypothetical protein ES703_32589 [subsurface metagenome]